MVGFDGCPQLFREFFRVKGQLEYILYVNSTREYIMKHSVCDKCTLFECVRNVNMLRFESKMHVCASLVKGIKN